MNKATSTYLDLVRFLAAATVFLVHAQYDRFTGTSLRFGGAFSDLGNDAVMVFFVLSGFVIAYVADKKERNLKDYTLSRLARLYSVVAPALLVTVAADYLGSRIDYGLYTGWDFPTDHPVWRLAANFFFVNELWFSSIRPFSNAPFWSLGYEFWYYVIFAAAFYLRRPTRYFAVAIACLIVGPKVLILLPIWLLGVGVYHIISTQKIDERLGWALFLGSTVTYAVYRSSGSAQMLLDWTVAHLGSTFVHGWLGQSKYFLSSYVIGPLIAIHFIGLTAIAARVGPLLACVAVPIRYLAGFTFAIYLFHFPLLQFFAVICVNVANEALRSALIVGSTIATIWVLGTVTEARRADLRNLLSSACDAIQRRAFARGKG